MVRKFGPVYFDEARILAFGIARDIASEGFEVLLVRDVLGRFSLVVNDKDERAESEQVNRWKDAFSRLGRYCSNRPVVCASQVFSAESLLNSPRAVDDPDGPSAAGAVRFLDNTVVGEDWAHVTVPAPEAGGARTHRTVLYGFKGGVGRSTATAMLARHLADRGHAVLVVDLDLESPGAGPLLMGKELPRHGLVDHLVEAALGNAEGLEIVTRSTYTPARTGDGIGELWVAPARGRDGDDVPYAYVDKLNRIYADTPGAPFADRLEQAVRACEDAVERIGDHERRPDVVLLDSRAGIHDIAAVAISRVCDLALLFGSDNAQTWAGYGDLFAAWQSTGQARRIREKLRMVASMVPDSVHFPLESYLERFRSHAFECFERLYDEVAPDEAQDDAEYDEDAPHWAVPILFEPGLVGMDAADAPGWQDRRFVRAAYGEFLETTTRWIEDDLAAGAGGEGP
ncbi:KGGVGR-motif variant AAA ATPase [Streptomyces sp. HB2AG]|uniref:KGGVGR-motif variant AAA ATPase n=1 Tax=Streptomyces sp. HB2AG TaxID=2983400 RepID=UPI0022AB1562|nr:P-loop NTPase [Streptomyces sp. HB2AG]MCZ2526994.1 AAA family ATPase [Streptomyces sp. HB2AG]